MLQLQLDVVHNLRLCSSLIEASLPAALRSAVLAVLACWSVTELAVIIGLYHTSHCCCSAMDAQDTVDGSENVAWVRLDAVLKIQALQVRLYLLRCSFVSNAPVQLRKTLLNGVCRQSALAEDCQLCCRGSAYILSMAVTICPTC